MKKYYELHVTLLGTARKIRPIIESFPGWKFSCISGDPVLGKGVKCYATKHLAEGVGEDSAIDILESMSSSLIYKKLKVLREKVELVVHDTVYLEKIKT